MCSGIISHEKGDPFVSPLHDQTLKRPDASVSNCGTGNVVVWIRRADIDQIERLVVLGDLNIEIPSATGTARQIGRAASVGIKRFNVEVEPGDSVVTALAVTYDGGRAASMLERVRTERDIVGPQPAYGITTVAAVHDPFKLDNVISGLTPAF